MNSSNMMSQSSQPEQEGEDSNSQQAIQLVNALALPMALKAVIDLGILEIMDKAGPNAHLSPTEIATQLASHDKPHASQMLDRILRLLSSYSILTCVAVPQHQNRQVQRLYGLAPLSRYFLPSQEDKPSVAPLFQLTHDTIMMQAWYHMKAVVLEGGVAFERAYGMTLSDYMGKDARLSTVFQRSMKDLNIMFMENILKSYKGFEGLKSIVDVGGGNGSILEAIIYKYPAIQGINFDLPPVIEKLPVHPSIQHVAGDMFTTTIPKADAIFIKWVLRLQDDEGCLAVLKKCHNALPDGGKLMVVELVIPDTPDTSIAKKSIFQFDLFLTNTNSQGRERTAGEYQALAKAAGFSSIQAAARSYDYTLLEFHKIATSKLERVPF